MKVRTIITFSFAGLLSIVVIQLGGMLYAYKTQMKEAEQLLNKCFWAAFSDAVQDMTNSLPYPNGMVVDMRYYSESLYENLNNYGNYSAQHTAQTLQKVYKMQGFPLAELDSILDKRLSRVHINGTTAIERFNVNTGEILESTNPDVHAGFTSVSSEKAFIYKERGEAVRAIVRFPFKELLNNVLILFVITFSLLGIAVYALIMQIKSLMNMQHNLQEQRQDFCELSEEMRLPVTEITSKIPRQAWSEIEEGSTVILGMTEKILSKVKEELLLNRINKVASLKLLSLVSLVGIFLLLAIWAGYLYHIGYRKLEFKVQDYFEQAFYRETHEHRYPLFAFANKYSVPYVEYAGITPYARRLYYNLVKLNMEKGYRIKLAPLYLHRSTSNYSNEDHRLFVVYTIQDTINYNTSIPIPFSLKYADSIFCNILREEGIQNESSMHWLKYPSKKLLIYKGSPYIRNMDITTRLLPLDRDSTSCVQGIVHAPQTHIVASIWYMLLPLGITFLFMCSCIYFQIRILRMQRHLKQFQKDFTYSMIHDMKSPLSSIIMGSQILASGKLAEKPEKEDKYKLAITDECEHLSMLLNRVLMLTQLDEGHLELYKEEVPLRPLIDDLLAKISLKVGKKIEFNTVYHRCETVYADVFCLREVLSNLLDNAIKYSRDEVKIDIICESEKGFNKIKICDNGLGIPVKDLSRIFNRFERSVAAARSSKGGATGFGLGLNYVQQVMLAHNGRVEVESEEGRFSEFTLFFPVRE